MELPDKESEGWNESQLICIDFFYVCSKKYYIPTNLYLDVQNAIIPLDEAPTI